MYGGKENKNQVKGNLVSIYLVLLFWLLNRWECINYSKQITKETVLNSLKQRTGRGSKGIFFDQKKKSMEQDAYHTKLREKKMKCQQGKWRLSKEKKVDNIFKCCKRMWWGNLNRPMTSIFLPIDNTADALYRIACTVSWNLCVVFSR